MSRVCHMVTCVYCKQLKQCSNKTWNNVKKQKRMCLTCVELHSANRLAGMRTDPIPRSRLFAMRSEEADRGDVYEVNERVFGVVGAELTEEISSNFEWWTRTLRDMIPEAALPQ